MRGSGPEGPLPHRAVPGTRSRQTAWPCSRRPARCSQTTDSSMGRDGRRLSCRVRRRFPRFCLLPAHEEERRLAMLMHVSPGTPTGRITTGLSATRAGLPSARSHPACGPRPCLPAGPSSFPGARQLTCRLPPRDRGGRLQLSAPRPRLVVLRPQARAAAFDRDAWALWVLRTAWRIATWC